MVISIEKATYLGDYKIQFEFSEGKTQVIDFEGFLKKARNPMTSKYLDKEKFASFSLDSGDIHWNDFEMSFPIWNLYEGRI